MNASKCTLNCTYTNREILHISGRTLKNAILEIHRASLSPKCMKNLKKRGSGGTFTRREQEMELINKSLLLLTAVGLARAVTSTNLGNGSLYILDVTQDSWLEGGSNRGSNTYLLVGLHP